MKVNELIELLKNVDPDLPVIMAGWDCNEEVVAIHPCYEGLDKITTVYLYSFEPQKSGFYESGFKDEFGNFLTLYHEECWECKG